MSRLKVINFQSQWGHSAPPPALLGLIYSFVWNKQNNPRYLYPGYRILSLWYNLVFFVNSFQMDLMNNWSNNFLC